MSPRRRPPDGGRDERYVHVEDLPSRDDILAALERSDSPEPFDALARRLRVKGRDPLAALRRRVQAMARDGQLVRTRDDRFGLAERMELVSGTVLAHPDGFGFVRPDRGGDDIYLERRQARRTLHGDKVLVRVAGFDRRDRPYGHLVEVIERANETIVGRYHEEHGIGFVIPDNRNINQDVLIPADAARGAGDGQIVVAAIEQQPDQRTQPIGRIVEVLGEHMAPGMEVEIAIRAHGLPSTWPDAVETEARRVPTKVRARDTDGRRDLRDLPLVTIDGADARDFDDAVHARRTPKGFVLHVAIADVSHYVQPGSALDDEAVERGTSVYFPDRVIPMLPEKLSNGICSLNPDVDRLAMVCEMSVSDAGEVRRARFYEAVIRSHARLVYEDVDTWLRGKRKRPLAGSGAVAENVECLDELYHRFRERRERRGALDVDTVEPRFVYDEHGKIASVEAVVRVDAHRIIEECMIAANVAAARFLERRRQPALFRVHEPPDEDKVEDLGRFLREIGLRFRTQDAPEPRDFARVLAAASDRADKRLIQTLVLRSLKLAVYSEENTGHFGLALPAYAHFTSPIRRYPDLVVHRAIKAALEGADVDESDFDDMAALAGQCSMRERRADDATRDAVAWLKCEFMLDKLGDRFPGVISGVAEFGVFVELEGIFVEGLVHVTALPGDYYHFDAVHHALTGRSSGRTFHIGQRVEVRVARVDLDERKIDFELVDGGSGRRRRRARR